MQPDYVIAPGTLRAEGSELGPRGCHVKAGRLPGHYAGTLE
jgi:hypothetical protein